MPSEKPRIATYTKKENVAKFKVIAAMHGKSMSEYLSFMIEREIKTFEKEHGSIITENN